MKLTRNTRSEILVLEALEKEPVMTTREIKEKIGLNQKTINSVILRLVKKGAVVRYPNLLDMRTKIVQKL